MTEEKPVPNVPEQNLRQEGATSPSPVPSGTQSTATPSGKRQAFRDLRRQLEQEDLKNPAVQKMLLDDLERAEIECENLQGYIERFHQADKRAAVLEEKLKTQTAFEILFGVGVGLGCAIIGLAPFFWSNQPQGWIALTIGTLLTIGSTVARVKKQ